MANYKICPVCGGIMQELEETEESLDSMTDGQQADYLAGFNHLFYCVDCNFSTVKDIEVEDSNFADIPSEYYLNAIYGLKDLKESINNFELLKPLSQDNFFIRLFYINSITILETYLSDALKYNVSRNYDNIKQFIHTYEPFKKEIKYTLPQIISRSESKDIKEIYDFMKNEALRELNELLYHNIHKIKEIYKKVLDVNFPQDLNLIFKGIEIRHDLVHRNGKNKDGKYISISLADLNKLIDEIEHLIDGIYKQL